MADETNTGATTGENSSGAAEDKAKPDPFVNLKSEMDRKLGNMASQLTELTETLKTKFIDPPNPNRVDSNSKKQSFKEKFYNDEDAAVDELRSEIKQDIRQELGQERKQTSILSSLYSDYPELTDLQNPLTQRAIAIHKGYDKADQANPTSLRLAALEAAQELDILPVRKRKSNQDEWTGHSGTNTNTSAPRQKRGEIPAETLGFAEAMGMNTKDPKVVEKLKERSKRQNWTRYSE